MNECEEDCGYCGSCLEHHEYTKGVEEDDFDSEASGL